MIGEKNIIIFGPPGSGKGTFATQLKSVFPKIVHISTGDIFREHLNNNTALGIKAKSYMEKGILVPDEIVDDMVDEILKRDDIKKNGFILDGYPRNLEQATNLDCNTNINLFLLLGVPRDIIRKRILGRFSCPKCGEIYNKYLKQPQKRIGDNKWICEKCGEKLKFEQRSDDTEKTLKKRLEIYDKEAVKIIEFYRNKGILKEIDATNTLNLSKTDLKELIYR